MKFNEYKGLDLAQIAADVLGEWDARDTFHKSITTREGHPAFVFYEGPPSANGMPGIHHVMARTIKDVFCRYKTQQGYLVHRKAGWDTHGLPVELGVEKKLGITKEDIGKKITIEEYKTTERPKVVMTWAPHPNALPQAVPNSFAEWMNAAGYDFVITHPEGYELAPQFVGNARVEYDQRKALEGADFVYAKNWAAYADPDYGKVLSRDRSWTVDAEKMALTHDAYFMHCLPVRRNMIVTDEVIESPRSLVIPEAANREISAQVVLKRLLEGSK